MRAIGTLLSNGRTTFAGDARRRRRPYIFGEGRVEIGNSVTLVSTPVRSHLYAARGAVLRIGDGAMIGHGAAIAAMRSVTIGPGARVGPFSSISDSDFHSVGDRWTAPAPRAIVIGSRARLGAHVTVLPGSIVGDDVVVDACSTVAGAVPSQTHVAGVPARGIGQIEVERLVGDDIDANSIAAVVMRTFGLVAPPTLEATPADIAEWDSLGTLKLIMSLEEGFGVRLREDEVAGVTRVSDLVSMVQLARSSGPRQQEGSVRRLNAFSTVGPRTDR